MINAASCGQAYEIILSLVIAWPGGDGANCAQLRGIGMPLMCLHMITGLHLTTSIKVQLVTEYGFRWTLCFGHVTFKGKYVAPEHDGVYHFCNNDGRKMSKWNYVVITTNMFLCGTVVSLNFWDVLISSGDVKLGVQITTFAAYWLKLVVCEYATNSNPLVTLVM